MTKDKLNFENILEGDFQKKTARINHLVNSSFIFICSVVFNAGFIGGIFMKNITGKIIIATFFFCIMKYFSRNKLHYSTAYGVIEKPTAFSLGASLFLLGSLLASQKMTYLFPSLLCLILGIYYFYTGYKKSTYYGWHNFLRNIQ